MARLRDHRCLVSYGLIALDTWFLNRVLLLGTWYSLSGTINASYFTLDRGRSPVTRINPPG